MPFQFDKGVCFATQIKGLALGRKIDKYFVFWF